MEYSVDPRACRRGSHDSSSHLEQERRKLQFAIRVGIVSTRIIGLFCAYKHSLSVYIPICVISIVDAYLLLALFRIR